MISIPGKKGRTCDGWTRRELLRVGGAAMLGLSLPEFLSMEALANAAPSAAPGKDGFGNAQSVILLYLQGGPSHIDIWDPKPNAPANIRGEFKPIPTKIKGTHISETMPMMAQNLDKATLIRSMSYTPNGLFNHTAAIYQMLTGYPPDKVSPSGQLEPPSPADFPTAGSHVSKLKPPYEAVLPFVELPRPLPESGIIAKGGAEGVPDKARERYGMHTFGQGLLLSRRLIEAGTRFVQMNWPSVANGNPETDSWDTHASNFGPLKNLHCPKLDRGLSALLDDMDQRGLLKETLVIAIGEFGRSPRIGVSTSGNGNAPDGRDHWPYCYTALIAGAGIRPGALYGKSDATGSSPAENPVHPTQILATVYHALGIDPHTIAYNHLNQPRELVQAEPVLGLFG